jgi:serine/threonine protein kinase
MITNNEVNDKFSIGTIISAKYKLMRLITKGSFSAVYECEHIIKKNKAVIKMETNPTAKKLMEHEVAMYLSLQKSKVRVPRIKNTGCDGNIQYIILEQLDQSLKNYKGAISIIDLYKQLYLLHQEGILHRDIKPDNFVVGFNQLVYMIDLGLAKRIDNKPSKGFTGNTRYASPSCFETNYIYTIKDDVMSLTFMCLDLKYKYLPWDYEGYENRKDIDYSILYPNELLCEIIKICLVGFDYSKVFTILDKTDIKINI